MTRPDPEDQLAGWTRQLADSGRVEVPFNRRKVLIWWLLTLLFVAAGVAMILTGDGAGWFVLGTFGFFALIWSAKVVREAGAVVIDRRGVTYEPSNLDVPWSELQGAYCMKNRGSELTHLLVTPECQAENLARRSRLTRLLWKYGRTPGMCSLPLPTPIAADGMALAAWLEAEVDARNPDGPASD